RMARNTSHVLGLESMLGVVGDAAFGSYHLENLTDTLCDNAWKLMQELQKGADLSGEVEKIRNKRLNMIMTREIIISGTNDFPDPKDELNFSLKPSTIFRSSRIFE